MAKNKTTQTEASVGAYVKTIQDEKRRTDFSTIIDLITKDTGLEPKMWGPAIVGFGSYHYKYESGHEGSAPLMGLASRTNAIALYLSISFEDREKLLAEFGKHKTAKACVYIQKLEDINTKILLKMVKNSIAAMKKHYPSWSK